MRDHSTNIRARHSSSPDGLLKRRSICPSLGNAQDAGDPLGLHLPDKEQPEKQIADLRMIDHRRADVVAGKDGPI